MDIIKNMFIAGSDSDYFSAEGVNFSSMKEFLISPLHYLTARESTAKSTPTLEFGSAFHCAVLTPEIFAETYLPALPMSVPLAERKAQKQLASEQNKKLYDADDLNPVVNAVLGDKVAFDLIETAIKENFIFWEDSSLLCKAKIDGYCPTTKTVFDLKTTTSVEPRSFTNSVMSYKYYLQASHYIEAVRSTGAEVKEYCIVAVEKTPPYDVVVYSLDEAFLNMGFKERKDILQGIKDCETFDMWLGVSKGEKLTLTPPAWAVK